MEKNELEKTLILKTEENEKFDKEI